MPRHDISDAQGAKAGRQSLDNLCLESERLYRTSGSSMLRIRVPKNSQ